MLMPSPDTVLFHHTWPSSRKKDENSLIFWRSGGDAIAIGYYCLWDAHEGTADTIGFEIEARELLLAVRSFIADPTKAQSAAGVSIGSHIRFEPCCDGVKLFVSGEHMGAGLDFTLEAVQELCAQLEKLSA